MHLMGIWIPILSIVTYIPLAGALAVVFLVPKERTGAIQAISTVIVLVDFVVSLPLWFLFERGRESYQFVEKLSWIPSLGVDYHFEELADRRRDLVHRGRLLLHGDLDPAEGVLRPAPSSADVHDRDFLLARPLPVLCLLGGHARPDVFPDRSLGK